MNKTSKTITVGIGLVALSALLVVGLSERGESQPASPDKLEIGIYAPTVAFSSSQDRSTYINSLGAAISQRAGVKVQAFSFTSFGQLKGKKLDFAVIDSQCYAVNARSGKLLANARVGGGTSRRWALYSSQGPKLESLQGKRIAYVKTGCSDDNFVDNAMLESEVSSRFFSGRVGKPDVLAAVAEVASRKGAQAVFAPEGSQKGLTKVFDAGSVPNPAFVQLNSKLSSSLVDKVAAAVKSYGGGGAIAGWSSADEGDYKSLRSSMGRRVKRGIFADPSPVRVDGKDVLIPPKSLDDTDVTPVGQHFEAPPPRMD